MAHPGAPQLTIGVDTHLDVHLAHASDQLGRRVDTIQIPTTPSGYQQLLAWAEGLGEPVAWGVEGTGCYGAALARFLAANHQVVVEVNRPDRAARARHGKSDPVDAQAAARAVQAGQVMVVPKAGGGQVETIGCLRVARSTGVRARTQTINALKALLVTAPVELREQLRGLSVTRLVGAAATLEPGPITSPLAAAMLALRTLAHRHQSLPADHLPWFVLDVVDQLDLGPFLAAYRADGHGRAAYEPRMLLAELLYGYCTGIRSSRQIERRCHEDIAFRVLCW